MSEMSDTPETPNTPPAEVPTPTPSAEPEPKGPQAPADPAPAPAEPLTLTVAELRERVVTALEDFIGAASSVRDADRAAAVERAGGDAYKVERFGFEPSRYAEIARAEEFLKAFLRG